MQDPVRNAAETAAYGVPAVGRGGDQSEAFTPCEVHDVGHRIANTGLIAALYIERLKSCRETAKECACTFHATRDFGSARLNVGHV